MATVIDDCLSARDGRLLVEGCDAHALAERHGTPLHVISEDQLRRNLRRIEAAFAAAWTGPVRILPAFKANPTLAVRRVLDEAGAGCDAFGPWELDAALRAGTPPERISFNGPAKDDAALARAASLGVRVTADSLDELERLDAIARGLGRARAGPAAAAPARAGADHAVGPARGAGPGRRRRARLQARDPRRPGRRRGRADRARRGARRRSASTCTSRGTPPIPGRSPWRSAPTPR